MKKERYSDIQKNYTLDAFGRTINLQKPDNFGEISDNRQYYVLDKPLSSGLYLCTIHVANERVSFLWEIQPDYKPNLDEEGGNGEYGHSEIFALYDQDTSSILQLFSDSDGDNPTHANVQALVGNTEAFEDSVLYMYKLI